MGRAAAHPLRTFVCFSKYLIFVTSDSTTAILFDIVVDSPADLAIPAEQQLGMDWRQLPGIPPDRRAVMEQTRSDRCVAEGGVHFCDF